MLAPNILEIDPKINVMCARFFITKEELEARINQICFYQWKKQAFVKFPIDNFYKIKDKHLMCGDIEMFVKFLKIL